MTNFRTGEIVLVAFPFSDWTTVKQRPAVVISSSRFNAAHRDVIFCAITSQIPNKISEDEYILNESEQAAANLPYPSIVKLSKIITLDNRLIRRRLGQLSEASTNNLLKKLCEMFRPE